METKSEHTKGPLTTMLENLCEVSGRQGGTIHQYLDITDPAYEPFKKAFYEYQKCGITFESKESLNKLANQYNIEINWGRF